MANVTAAMVKELRERTGAGMLDCKNVLVDVDGDIDKAIETLREKGLAKAAKKSGRVASEGLVRVKFSDDHSKAGIVEVNSETDFVAKNQDFIDFVDAVSCMAVDTDTTSMEDFMNKNYDGAKTIQQKITDMIATIGENLSVRRFKSFNTPGIKYTGYLHGTGSIGVIVGFKTDATVEEVDALGKDIAMQIASMNPLFIDESQIDPQYIENERNILVRQAINEGKPEDIVEKMVNGRLKKELKETCLLEQKFVKNGEINVANHIKDAEKEIGKSVEVVEMARFEVGEGIEKKEEDFAAEVAKQMGN
jgi:elongation factor Ts